MSKLLEDLKIQMQTVFGESFGQIDEVLDEAKKYKNTEFLKKKFRQPVIAKTPEAPAKKYKNTEFLKKKMPKKGEKDRAQQNLKKFYANSDKPSEKPVAHAPAKSASGAGGSGASAGKAQTKAAGTGGGAGGFHNPFRHSSSLGVGPGTPPGFRPVHGKRKHNEKHCWHCSCGNVYNKGCTCVGTGATKDCPKGHNKHVQIHKAYRHAYNDMYHAWRRGKGASSNKKA